MEILRIIDRLAKEVGESGYADLISIIIWIVILVRVVPTA